MDKLISVANDQIYTSEILINKSRFLCFIKHVIDKIDAENFVADIKKQYKDARHVCYAYRLTNTSKMSDDGEPSGTAGRPILQILEKQNLYNLAAVVVRYFGGIKLGAGGLLRAYSSAVTECLGNAKKVAWTKAKLYEISMDYKEYQAFINSIKNRKIQILSTDFTDGAKLQIVADCDENIEGAHLCGETMHSFEG